MSPTLRHNRNSSEFLLARSSNSLMLRHMDMDAALEILLQSRRHRPVDVLTAGAWLFPRLPDNRSKHELARAAFGRFGIELVPYLNDGFDGLSRLYRQIPPGCPLTPPAIVRACIHKARSRILRLG
jgi:hypothetical protein